MHVLVTADTMSGVWTYTRELVTGLVTRGIRVTLVSLGEIPLPQQTSWMESLHGLDYRPTAFRLDWMQEGQFDLEESSAYLAGLVAELKPDVLHLNQLCYGNLPVKVPRIVVAHGDMISWWKSVHGHEPKPSQWLRWYREVVSRGLAKASTVVAPTRWMLDTIRTCYAWPKRDAVIYNGRNPIFFNPYTSKDDSVLAVGRLYDAGKQVNLLTQHTHPLPVCIVGAEAPVASMKIPIRADVKLATEQVCVASRARRPKLSYVRSTAVLPSMLLRRVTSHLGWLPLKLRFHAAPSSLTTSLRSAKSGETLPSTLKPTTPPASPR